MYFGALVAQNRDVKNFMVMRIMDDQSGVCDPWTSHLAVQHRAK